MNNVGSEDTKQNELKALAEDVLDISRNRLLVNLRYMDMALTFHTRETFEGTFASDGKVLYYDPVFVIRSYNDSKNRLIRTYLHTVLHCIFMHPFVSSSIDKRLWDLACDIAVESTINELDIPCTRIGMTAEQSAASRKIRRAAGFLTAEKIYASLRNGDNGQAADEKELKRLEGIFQSDEHSPWYGGEETCSLPAKDGQIMIMQDLTEAAADWKKIAEQIEMELETFAKVKGRYASSLIQNLRAVNRTKDDYGEFLRSFSAINEKVKVSDDEFDYIYYNYGLQHYHNMPLIEPLEYREDRRIHDFVIAVDTSGSVAGSEVQEFLQKTYDILKSRSSFDNRINVHIIQCDAKIQSDTVITCDDDLERYIGVMEIRGLGGTDFRPVFEYVDRLLAAGEFSDLKGLIYFTDGLGTYPHSKPDYKTAFVFKESGYNIPEVPVWAMKVIL